MNIFRIIEKNNFPLGVPIVFFFLLVLQTNLVSDLTKAKASWKRENEALYYLRSELEEVLKELHNKEREVIIICRI